MPHLVGDAARAILAKVALQVEYAQSEERPGHGTRLDGLLDWPMDLGEAVRGFCGSHDGLLHDVPHAGGLRGVDGVQLELA